ncbi:SNF7 family protein [Actinidia rufa]|uniref:SNF7 family protein n=1 Tax=Actinidia rufa TaxID=165716 RepID=A0A7J0E489_9ERIC|nr:SNF7 family protein [Actinidia rufa]
MGEAMKGVTKAMGQMNRQMNLPALQKIMQEFEKQNEKMEMVSEVMGDAIDDALEGDEEEEETEELVSQVLDEIGINMNSELLNAPSSVVAAPAAQNKVAQVEATGNDDSGIDSDLQSSPIAWQTHMGQDWTTTYPEFCSEQNKRLHDRLSPTLYPGLSSPEIISPETPCPVRQLNARSERIALMEGGKGLEMKETSSEVVVSIFRETESLKTSSSSLEITNSSPTPNRPPIISVGSVTQRRSIARSAYSKPKSRLVELSYPINSHLVEESSQFVSSSSPSSPTRKTNAGTPKENVKTDPVAPKATLMVSQGGEDDDDEDVYTTTNLKLDENPLNCWQNEASCNLEFGSLDMVYWYVDGEETFLVKLLASSFMLRDSLTGFKNLYSITTQKRFLSSIAFRKLLPVSPLTTGGSKPTRKFDVKASLKECDDRIDQGYSIDFHGDP